MFLTRLAAPRAWNKTLASVLALSVTVGSAPAFASSHREAPNIAGNPRVDSTDLYMFRSYEAGRSAFTTIIANYVPLQDAYGGPNYFALDPNAIYEIHIDNNGDAIEDLTFQFDPRQSLPGTGGNGIALNIGGQSVAVPLKNVGVVAAGNDANLNFVEQYTLTLIQGDRRTGTRTPVTNTVGGGSVFTKPLDYVGDKTFTNTAGYEAYANQYMYNISIPGCGTPGKVFVGQRKEGFAVNLGKVFDLVNIVPIDGASYPDSPTYPGGSAAFAGGITQNAANNIIDDANVTSFALEVPTACLTGTGNGVIGAWTTASLPQAKLLNPSATFANPEVVGGAFTQVSRLGMPLVNELVIGLKDKDKFSASKPRNDGQFATYVTNPALPALLQVLFGVTAPTNFPRNDLVAAFLTGISGVNQQSTVTASEMLRLNTGIAITARGAQSTLGVIGDDLAGFPNGRRPGDDVVDIALRVAMGRLCHTVPVSGSQAALGLCTTGDAPVGRLAFTDGAPLADTDFRTGFPYLNTPISGSD